jgi:putative peptidoglycan lipid II flippase
MFKVSTIAKNSAVMSIAVFCSRILGLIRDQVMAAFFGTTYIADAFNISFNIPNLLRRLFGEGALSAAFVPIYNEMRLRKGEKASLYFAINVLSILSFFLLVLTFLGMLFTPIIVRLIYSGLAEQTSELAIKLTRIIFPYLFFIGLSSTFIAILNSHSKFFITGLSSGLLNIGWIATLLCGVFILKKNDASDLVYYAAYGVLLGGFLQTIINLPFLKSVGYQIRVILKFQTEAMLSLWYRFVPAMFGLGVREINLIADAVIASFLPIGSISALGFANRLMQLPLGIFGISVGTAVLPEYSRQFTEGSWSDISETLRFSIHFILYLLLPISVIMIVGSDVFIRLIFERGEFNELAVQMTRIAFIYYSLGLCVYGLNQVVIPLFYAAKDTKTPVKIAACMVGLNIALSVTLMQFMAHAGIALSTCLTAVAQFICLMVMLRKKLPQVVLKNYLINILKLTVIVLILIGVMYGTNFIFLESVLFISNKTTFLLLQTIVLLGVGFASLIVLFQIIKPEYYREVSEKIRRRLPKSSVQKRQP